MLSMIRARKSGVQVFLDAVMVVLATAIFIPLAKVTHSFGGHCLLNSNIVVKKITVEAQTEYAIDLGKTTYDHGNTCDYTTYINVVAAIHSLVWIWFFLHMNALKRKNGSFINLLLPALVLRISFIIMLVVSSSKISSGFSAWCKNITKNLKQSNLGDYSCKKVQDLKWDHERSQFYTYSLIATICSWLLALVVVISCGVTVIHLYDDFLHTMEPELNKLKADESRASSSSGDDDSLDYGDSIDHQGVVNEGADDSDTGLDPRLVTIKADLHARGDQEREFELNNGAHPKKSSGLKLSH